MLAQNTSFYTQCVKHDDGDMQVGKLQAVESSQPPARIAELPDIFMKIVRKAQLLLYDLSEEVTDADREYIKKCFSREQCPRIDYDRYGVAFADSYFLENFLKAARVFVREKHGFPRHIVDFGCGSGATTLAYLASLDDSVSVDKWTVKVTLLDCSRRQLDLAKKFIDLARPELSHLNLIVQFHHCDFLNLKPAIRNAGVVLFGHVLNENSLIVRESLERAFHTLGGNGRIYIIERTDDPVWENIERNVPRLALPAKYAEAVLDTNPRALDQYPQAPKKNQIVTRYLVLSMPEKRYCVHLLKRYFTAWETKSVELLAMVFAPSALYFEEPEGHPLCGLKEIERYWQENVCTQRNIRTKLVNVAYGDDYCFAEWEASFERANMKHDLKGVLILKTSTSLRLVVELREYFKSRKKRIDAI